MAKATPIDKLGKALQGILDEYADEVNENLSEAVKDATKQGVKALKTESKQTFGDGEYAKSWTSQVETGRTSAQGTIYSKKPGLPHLLENGHMLRNGKFWSGKKHIEPVEEKLIELFEKMARDSV